MDDEGRPASKLSDSFTSQNKHFETSVPLPTSMFQVLVSAAFFVAIAKGGASSCSSVSGVCPHDGSGNYINLSGISYSTSTGMFTGNLITNLCPSSSYSNYSYSGSTLTSQGGAMASCMTTTISKYTGPTGAPLRQAIGYTVNGENIFGPMDNGFTSGQVCTGSSCDSGTDVYSCFTQMAIQCGSSFNYAMGLDMCNGHATPYHLHKDAVCLYDRNATGHSPLIGFALDGRGIYGYKESSYSYPTDLDYCGGHYGPVPATTVNGVTFPAASYVYHYHMQPQAPFSLGCYGPVADLATCKSLYTTCGTGTSSMSGTDSSGNTCSYTFDTDCPCYGRSLVYSNNQMCGVATTQTAAVTFTAWGSSSSTPSSTASGLSAGAIAGIVIGCICGVAAILSVAAFIMRQRARKAAGRTEVEPLSK
ncbi:YHYH protein-domain-containing protein [Chytriomyces sp. MP71]|nr:YHYH protein-domain-containing protein [Chytriomyces sp. MP71]